MSKRSKNPKAVLLDIEGTTIDSQFVSKTLFPFFKQNFERFFNETYETEETTDGIRRLRNTKRSESPKTEMPAIVVGSKKQVIPSVVENINWQLKNKSKQSPELKQFELLCWLWGYENTLLESHVFDDVSYCLHDWKTKTDMKIYTFSSGMVLAQKLMFVKTNHGNILSLIDDFFDSNVGSKQDSQSYKQIANIIGVEVKQILFITDDPKEAKTALNAGLLSVIIERPGNKTKDEHKEIQRINSFKDLKF